MSKIFDNYSADESQKEVVTQEEITEKKNLMDHIGDSVSVNLFFCE